MWWPRLHQRQNKHKLKEQFRLFELLNFQHSTFNSTRYRFTCHSNTHKHTHTHTHTNVGCTCIIYFASSTLSLRSRRLFALVCSYRCLTTCEGIIFCHKYVYRTLKWKKARINYTCRSKTIKKTTFKDLFAWNVERSFQCKPQNGSCMSIKLRRSLTEW